jgi:aspartyl-tRNA(Asn)/glutamyl-tRNA(Gln) amidotransferase subunit A
MSQKLVYHSFRNKLIENKTSCLQEVNLALENIKKFKDYNIFLEVFEDEALNRAEFLDQNLAELNKLPALGMIVALKDNICYANHKVSAASKFLEGFESQYSATVVQRLLDAGAIVIGRTNCDEFAMGSSNEKSAFGAVINPLNQNKVPGGSSGGSAAAVAAGACHVALGSDTGGSIRQPAAFCGVSGFKPSYGTVSRFGLIAFASSFDQIGPMAADLIDLELTFSIIAGKDKYDATSSSIALNPIQDSNEEKQHKIGFLKELIENEAVEDNIKEYHIKLYNELKSRGHDCEWVSFPYLDVMIPIYHTLATAEASSNLSRFTGMTYANRAKLENASTEQILIDSRSHGFGEEVKRRIMLGTFVLSEGYYDAYYGKAQKVRRLVKDYLTQLFNAYDFLICPTTPTPAFNLNEIQDPIKMYFADLLTLPASISGIPAISVPAKNNIDLPFGVQVMGNYYKDYELINFAKKI